MAGSAIIPRICICKLTDVSSNLSRLGKTLHQGQNLLQPLGCWEAIADWPCLSILLVAVEHSHGSANTLLTDISWVEGCTLFGRQVVVSLHHTLQNHAAHNRQCIHKDLSWSEPDAGETSKQTEAIWFLDCSCELEATNLLTQNDHDGSIPPPHSCCYEACSAEGGSFGVVSPSKLASSVPAWSEMWWLHSSGWWHLKDAFQEKHDTLWNDVATSANKPPGTSCCSFIKKDLKEI